MSLTLEEIVKIAIENQHLILEQELKKRRTAELS